MTHIRNRHHESPATPFLLGKDGIIEIARLSPSIVTSDVPQILATSPFGFLDLERQRLCFLHRWNSNGRSCLRSAISISMPGSGIVAEYFNDTADWLRMAIWLFDDFDHHDLSSLDLGLLLRCNENILVDASVFRHNHRDAVLDQHATNYDYWLVRALRQ